MYPITNQIKPTLKTNKKLKSLSTLLKKCISDSSLNNEIYMNIKIDSKNNIHDIIFKIFFLPEAY